MKRQRRLLHERTRSARFSYFVFGPHKPRTSVRFVYSCCSRGGGGSGSGATWCVSRIESSAGIEGMLLRKRGAGWVSPPVQFAPRYFEPIDDARCVHNHPRAPRLHQPPLAIRPGQQKSVTNFPNLVLSLTFYFRVFIQTIFRKF